MTVIQVVPPRVEFHAVVREDQATDGSRIYLAEIPQLPGCMAHGETEDEALQNLEEAAELYRETRQAGREVLTPHEVELTSGTEFVGAQIGTVESELVRSTLELHVVRLR